MIVNDDIPSHIIFHDTDFPSYYINKKHPNDFMITSNPIQQEMIFHQRFHHNRLILRTSILIEERFISVSFICDTGAPDSFYLCDELRQRLSSRIFEDELGVTFIKIGGKKFFVGSPPSNHDNINILGLKALSIFGLYLEDNGFLFENLPGFL